jgi:hypothetical protein
MPPFLASGYRSAFVGLLWLHHRVVSAQAGTWREAPKESALCDPFTRNRESGGWVAKGGMAGTF